MVTSTELLLFICFTLTAIGIALVYLFQHDHDVHDKPLKKSFDEDSTIFCYGLIFNIAVTIPAILEIVIDVVLGYGSGVQDISEKIFMVLLIAGPGTILLAIKSFNIPYLFCCIQAMQYVGCLCAILSLCHKLVPKYFKKWDVVFIQLFFGLTALFTLFDFGKESEIWPIMFAAFTAIASIGYLLFRYFKWIQSLPSLFTLLDGEYNQWSLNEKSCFLYLSSTLVTLILIPGMTALSKFPRIENFDTPVIYTFIYSLAAFMLFPCMIPGRLAKYQNIVESHRDMSSRATLRYLAHELRTPLNVICTGVEMAIADVPLKYTDVHSSLRDIQHAGIMASNIMDDLTLIEKAESGLFSLDIKKEKINQVFTHILNPIRRAVEDKGRILEINTDETVSTESYVDKVRLEVVVRTLVMAALQDSTSVSPISVFITYFARELVTTRARASSIMAAKIAVEAEESEPEALAASNSTAWSIESFCRLLSTYVDGRSPLVHPTADDMEIPGSLVNPGPQQTFGYVRIDISHQSVSYAGAAEGTSTKVLKDNHKIGNLADKIKLAGGDNKPGLGMWILQRIILLHDGLLTTQPGPGKFGQTTSIRLKLSSPIVHVSEEDQPRKLSSGLARLFNRQATHKKPHQTPMAQDGSPSAGSEADGAGSGLGGDGLEVGARTSDGAIRGRGRASISLLSDFMERGSLLSVGSIEKGKLAGRASVRSLLSVTSLPDSVQASGDNLPVYLSQNKRRSQQMSANFSRKFSRDEGDSVSGSRKSLASASGHRLQLPREVEEQDRFVASMRDTAAPSELVSALDATLSVIGSPEAQTDIQDMGLSTAGGGEEKGADTRHSFFRLQPEPLRMLIVDDSSINRRVMGKLLTRMIGAFAQVSIDEADDGQPAVNLVNQSLGPRGIQYSAIFMDNIMISMHGPKAAKLMRVNGYDGLLVGVTGNVLPEDVQDFIKHGATAVLGKPVDTTVLRQLLGEHLGLLMP